jgi:integrase
VAVSPLGKKSFLLYRKVKGRPERIGLGPFPDLSIEQARGIAEEMNSKIALGLNPAEAKRALRAEPTFGELFAEYLEKHAKVHKRTWEDDDEQRQRYLAGWTAKKASDIRKSDVLSVHSALGREHPYAANRLLALVRSVFNRAREWGWPLENPAHGVKKFPERQRERFLEAHELPRFFLAVAQEPNHTVRDYILLSLLTGARRANVQSMRWQDVDLERGMWTIPMTKSGEPHTVPLTPEAVGVLNARQRGAASEWVFPSHGKSGHLVEPKMAWRKILGRAAIGDLRLHDLRRTLGSWQAATGASLPMIGKTLGHKNTQTTAIYARLDTDPVRKSLETATQAMLTAGNVLPKPPKPRKRGRRHAS